MTGIGGTRSRCRPLDWDLAAADVLRLVRRGDLFQANICLRLEADFDGDRLDAFCHAATRLDPPYASFLRLPGGTIVSMSPELFLRRTGTRASRRQVSAHQRAAHHGGTVVRTELTMGQLKPLVISESDVARDSWDDTTRGVLGFRTLFSAGTTATQALTAGIADLNAGDWLGLHRHTHAEIYYVVEGHGTVTLDGVDYPVSAGTAVYLPGDTEHGIRNIGPAPLRFFYAFAVDSFDDVTYRFSQ